MTLNVVQQMFSNGFNLFATVALTQKGDSDLEKFLMEDFECCQTTKSMLPYLFEFLAIQNCFFIRFARH